MPNLKRIISGHNAKVVNSSRANNAAEPGCNCEVPENCPLRGQCQQRAVIYRATITTDDVSERRVYVGATNNTFKMRYYGHASDLRVNKSVDGKKGGTEMSRYVWLLKDRGKEPDIRWEIIRRCQPYRSGKRVCDVCNTEKLEIMKHMGPGCVNLRSELNNKCPHGRSVKLQKASNQRR